MLNELAKRINQNAKDHGFWEGERNFGEMLMLVTSELAEALEEHRDGKPATYPGETKPIYRDGVPTTLEISKPEGVAVELADALIRILDTMHSLDVDIDEIVSWKMRYNETRPYKHGKAY